MPSVFLLMKRGDQLLCIRRAGTGYSDGLYSLPAGHLDGGESAVAAVIREAKEEVGVDVDIADVRLAHTSHRVAEEGDHERLDMYFVTTKWRGEPKNMEPHKCDQVKWFDLGKLPENMVSTVRQAILHISEDIIYSDDGF